MPRLGGKKRPSPCTSDDEDDNKGPSCWICLENGVDESGQPLVRDCSCRGNSGFAHVSCITKYAEKITREIILSNYAEKMTREVKESRNSCKFIRAWTGCPNCHQDYEHEVADSLVERCTAFVEGTYPGDLWFRVHAIYLKVKTLKIEKDNQKHCIQVANELVSTVDTIRDENRSLTQAILYFEIAAYELLALVHELEGTQTSLKDAVTFHTKCRDIYVMIGIPNDIAHAEASIAKAKSKLNGNQGWTTEDALKDCQDYYNESVEEGGEDSCVAMLSTFRLADALKAAHRGIEAERVLAKLATTAQRVHGLDHYFTRDIRKSSQLFKRRYVSIKGRPGERFRALRYQRGDRKCIVRGPIVKPRNLAEEKTFIVHNDECYPARGTPVTCIGENIGMLLGEVRSEVNGVQELKVHFEDSNLEPRLVSPNNMRIVFELPNVE